MDSHETHSRPQSVDPTTRQTPLSSPVVASSNMSSVSSVTSPLNQNHFYHYNTPTAAQMWSQTSPQYPTDPTANPYMAAMWQNPDYYRQYVDQYYREYYRQYLQQQRLSTTRPSHASSVSSVSSLQRQPLKYGSHRCHARAVFSQHNNHLLFLDNLSPQKTLRVYSLCDLFVDYLFPEQMFHLLLRAVDTRLPFASRDTCLEWIRSKRQLTTATTPTTDNFELKLILKVIQMLLKQNGIVSGLDLSELLFDLIDFQTLNQSFVYSENEFQNNALNQFRALLIRGQKSVALSHALNTGLFAHALTLSYLDDALNDTRRHRRQTTTEETTLKTVRKFCDTLRADDPIAVFYNSLINEICGKRSIFSLSFESFLILLSNERDLKSIEIQNSENTQTFRHLLDLIKSLMTSKTTTPTTETTSDDFVLSDDLFDSDLDSVLVNECLEFSRFAGKRFNPKLLERKVKFVSVLFDFGFVSNALQYCKQFKQFCDFESNSSARIVVKELESRFSQNYSEHDFDDTPTTQTTPTTDVYHNDSQTSVETTPEHVVKSQMDSSPEDAPIAQSEEIDFYNQMIPQMSVPPPVNPVAPVAPPVPPEPPVAPSVSQNVISSPEMVPTFVATPGPLLEPPIPMSFVSQSDSLPKMDFKNEIISNGIPNNFNDRLNDTTTATTLNDRGVTQTTTETTTKEEPKANQNSGLLGKFKSLIKPRNQVHLPDDSKPKLVFDKNTNQWIDTSEANGSAGGAPPGPPPPPMIPVAAQNLRFDPRRQRANRYVDITRK